MFYWVVGISAAIIAIAFIVLTVFLIVTLISVMRSLSAVEKILHHSRGILLNVDDKIHAFDPYFRMASSFGQKVEKKAEDIEEQSSQRKEAIGLLMEWAMMGLSLFKKIRGR